MTSPDIPDDWVEVARTAFFAERDGFNFQEVATVRALAAVAPLIEARVRQQIADATRSIPRSRAVNDTEWDHVQIDAVEDCIWNRRIAQGDTT